MVVLSFRTADWSIATASSQPQIWYNRALFLVLFVQQPAGQLESTMTLSYLKASKLKQWLARSDCPPFLRECKVVFDKAFAKRESNDPPASSAFGPVPAGLENLVHGPSVALRARHVVEDIVYSRCSTHVGNSLIMFYPQGDQALPPSPGSIQEIVVYPNRDVVYIVKHQMPAGPELDDPFSEYPHFPAKLYHNLLSPELEMVRPDWVLSHYAQWAVDVNNVVVLTLSHVR